jgi:hypothetical protein
MYSEFRYFAEITSRGPMEFRTEAQIFAEVLERSLPAEYPQQVRLRALRHVRVFTPDKTFTLEVLGLNTSFDVITLDDSPLPVKTNSTSSAAGGDIADFDIVGDLLSGGGAC